MVAIGLGLMTSPKRAMEAAVAQFEARARQSKVASFMRMAASFSDGMTLYAVRYASDDRAPSLFYQWNGNWKGWAVVSEPYDTAHGGWIEVTKGSFCAFSPTKVHISPFRPSHVKRSTVTMDILVEGLAGAA